MLGPPYLMELFVKNQRGNPSYIHTAIDGLQTWLAWVFQQNRLLSPTLDASTVSG